MGLFDATALEWWLPAGYITGVGLVEVLRKVFWNSTSYKLSDDATDVEAQNGTLRALLLEASAAPSREETSEGSQWPQYYATSTGVLWVTLTCTSGLCIYQGARAIIEVSRNGAGTQVFVSSIVLCLTWAAASVLRSRDHWREAAKPAMIDGNGKPVRRRMWWVLWPFFNLSLITAITAEVSEAKKGNAGDWSDFTDVVADDRLWYLGVLLVTLILVSNSVLRGAEVRLCLSKPLL